MSLGRGTIGYIPKGFPRISETFVANEILELERLGLRIEVFSLINPAEHGVQPSARAVRAPVHYVPEHVVRSLHRVLPAHVAFAGKHPRVYWKTLGRALRRAWQRRSMASLRRFGQAGFLVERLLGDRNISHFHAHFCHGPTTVAMFVRWLTGATFSFTAHAKDLYTTAPEALREKMREAEFVLTCTEANRAYLEQIGGDVASVHRIYHGIDVQRFTPGDAEESAGAVARERASIDTRVQSMAVEDAGVPLVMSVGRLVPKKGHDVFLRACAILRDRGVRFRGVIHGEGPQRGELEALRRELRLDELVQLPGRILQDDLVARYREAAVFALACQVLRNGDRDGLPNVLIEALAMRVPVVSTNISGVPELIEHGVHGVLVEPRAPAQMADGIERLLGDRDLGRRLASAGRQRVLAEFDTRRNTRHVLELFEALGDPKDRRLTAAPEIHTPAATSSV